VKFLVAVFLVLALPVRAKIDHDLEGTLEKLKQAGASRDAALVRTLATEIYRMAAEESAGPLAADAANPAEYAKKYSAWLEDIRSRADYVMYTTALSAKVEDAVALISAMEALNPSGKYLDMAYPTYFAALQRTGQAARIVPVAQEALKHFPDNEDVLLVLADNAMARNQTARAGAYAERLLAALARHPKPEGYSVADWGRKRDFALGRARWMAGLAHNEKQQFGEADKDLRTALPLVKNDDAVRASVLFYLGVINYQIGATMLDRARVMEAASFSDQAAVIPGPLSQQAWRNAIAMRQAAQKMR
jgi:hypothetical protein